MGRLYKSVAHLSGIESSHHWTRMARPFALKRSAEEVADGVFRLRRDYVLCRQGGSHQDREEQSGKCLFHRHKMSVVAVWCLRTARQIVLRMHAKIVIYSQWHGIAEETSCRQDMKTAGNGHENKKPPNLTMSRRASRT